MKMKLIHKLLIAMFACAALVLVLFTLVTRASIGRGFVDFLQHQERSQLEQLVPDLVEWYDDHGSWDILENNPREFYRLVFTALLQRSDTRFEPGTERVPPSLRNGRWLQRPPGAGKGGQRPGPPGAHGRPEQRQGQGRFNALAERIFLLDGNKHPVIGAAPPDLKNDALLPIVSNGVEIGWLGVALMRGMKPPEEEIFIRQLRNNLLFGLGIGLGVAALLAWLLARHLSRPVNEVAGSIRALAAGDFNSRLKIKGSDEIATLGDDVNRLSSALSEHETARKRWISDMAHELRTPLAIISGELEAISDGVRPLDREQLGSVRDEVMHLSCLVNDLHNLTMTDSGALAYKMQTVDLNELLVLAIDSFKGGASEKNLEIRFTHPDQRINVLGDEKRLRQLLHNLLDNSVRYTDAGGVISIMLETVKQTVQLTINDTAPGASAEECKQLFERLYRLEGSRNRNSGGSGLGLAICRNIVEAHGGQISAEPGPDGGVLITAILPLQS